MTIKKKAKKSVEIALNAGDKIYLLSHDGAKPVEAIVCEVFGKDDALDRNITIFLGKNEASDFYGNFYSEGKSLKLDKKSMFYYSFDECIKILISRKRASRMILEKNIQDIDESINELSLKLKGEK